jgi:spermidine/putrescine transport system ATP-binding protein
MIAGLEQPDAGSIRIAGQNMAYIPIHRRPVNTVFQSYALFSHMNIFDNVAFGLRERHKPTGEITRAVREALALVRLSGYEHRRPSQLSGGQQQRVALARAIINEPAVLLLDEPLGALDLKLRRAMQVELKSLQQRLGMTFLYVTHDQEEALSMSDRIAVMQHGRIEQIGTPEDVYERPASPYVADFVGEANILEGSVRDHQRDVVTVEVAPGQCVRAGGPDDLRPSTRVWLIIRPEKILVRRGIEPDGEAAWPLSGIVRTIVFLGMYRRLTVELSDATVIVVSQPNISAAGPVPTQGEPIALSWAYGDAWTIAQSRDDAARPSSLHVRHQDELIQA